MRATGAKNAAKCVKESRKIRPTGLVRSDADAVWYGRRRYVRGDACHKLCSCSRRVLVGFPAVLGAPAAASRRRTRASSGLQQKQAAWQPQSHAALVAALRAREPARRRHVRDLARVQARADALGCASRASVRCARQRAATDVACSQSARLGAAAPLPLRAGRARPDRGLPRSAVARGGDRRARRRPLGPPGDAMVLAQAIAPGPPPRASAERRQVAQTNQRARLAETGGRARAGTASASSRPATASSS